MRIGQTGGKKKVDLLCVISGLLAGGDPGFRTVLCWFCPHRLGAWRFRDVCFVWFYFAIPISRMMQCHHLSHSIDIANSLPLNCPFLVCLFVYLFCSFLCGWLCFVWFFFCFCCVVFCPCVMAVDGTCWTSTVFLLIVSFATYSHQEVRVCAVIREFV